MSLLKNCQLLGVVTPPARKPGLLDLCRRLDYDPDQPRDENGQWSETGAGGSKSSSGRTRITLHRAAKDDYVDRGYSFGESREVAEAYRDNPSFGGQNLYSADIDVDSNEVLDLTESSAAEVAADFDLTDPGAIGVDEWVPRTEKLLDRMQERGIHWVKVRESYPEDTTTWIYIGGGSADEPELKSG